jgi:hypothetical protein
MEDDRLESLR